MLSQSFNLGFVQGSGLGPTLFLVLASDLNILSSNNELNPIGTGELGC